MLQTNNIKASHGAKHSVKRLGRGSASGRGTTGGRGGKGQTARSGGSKGLHVMAFKRQMQSAPKLRGFKSLGTKPTEVYLSELEDRFKPGDAVTLQTLQAAGLVSKNSRTAKIVSTGELTKKLIITGVPTTKGALEKIKAAGGEVK